jgi:pyruvate formate lyase activating enzyme
MISSKEQNIRYNSYTNTDGIIFEIERFSVNDGPGIRTLVFLKGCPLRCLWCSNPESHSFLPQLVYWRSRCIGCKECIKVCPNKALLLGKEGIVINRSACITCGQCRNKCNSKALLIVGKRMTVAEVMHEVAKDRKFYEVSGGGVTFSGGEPMAQPAFLYSLVKVAKEEGYNVCIETCGFVPWQSIEPLLPFVDVFLYDIKAIDDETHIACTRSSNRQILDNFKRLSALKEIIVRFPVIPEYNDSSENIEQMICFLKRYHKGKRIDLLPYHRLGVSKYQRLGIEYRLKNVLPPSREKMQELREMFLKNGFIAEIGG